MSYKGKFVEYKEIGWVGYSDGKPFFEETYDDYSEIDNKSFDSTHIFKNKKIARKRFQDVRRVYVEVK